MADLRARYAAHGQDHVFRFWETLDAPGRERLAAQAERIDLDLLARVHEQTAALAAPGARTLAPPRVDRLPEHGGSAAKRSAAAERGEDLLREGAVAALVVAGGQGTRLGFDGPKGTFPIGPVTDRSLFEIQAQRLRGARRRYGAALPWYVMTSPATDAATREFFAARDYFGLPPEDVVFFRQSTVPALDFEGRLLLEAPDRIAESPNGHGGTFTALADSGALADMERRGVRTISYYQVDNPLVPILDPVFLGVHVRDGAEMSGKVIRKLDAMEKMGVFAEIDGRVGIVEYTEIDDEHRFMKDAEGELVYWAGSPAIHALEVSFVRRVAAAADEVLPYHASAKKIPHVDADGRTVQPDEPNGHKLERFLFDALGVAERVALLEVERRLEYSPVKNAEGADSGESARRALTALYADWLRGAGIEPPADEPLELDHERFDGAESVRDAGITSWSEATAAPARRAGGEVG